MRLEYRRLGISGLKISEISLGTWLTYGAAVEMEESRACVRTAYELGVNHFDCAVSYGNHPHEAEAVLGQILPDFPRPSYSVTSKLFWRTGPSVNESGLSRKQLVHHVDLSLRALCLDYIDIYYCHRYDPDTDLEETLRALDDLVAAGKILYYGISEWKPAQIRDMASIVDRRNLRRPVANQPGYNMFRRDIEAEILGTCAENGLGLVVFSPLAQGLLTGKYRAGAPMPAGTRGADAHRGRFLHALLEDGAKLERVERLGSLAAEAGMTTSQMALAWVLRHPEVTSALVGASRVEQIEENVKASGIKLEPDLLAAIEEVLR